MKYFSRMTASAVLLFFWAFTWHAYAASAIDVRTSGTLTSLSTGFDDERVDKVHQKSTFKRRPFLVKSDIAMRKPFEPDDNFFPSVRLFSLKPSAVPSSIRHVGFLRAPPALF